MNIKEKLNELINKQEDVLEFLDALSSKERKELVPTVKKLAKELCSFTELDAGTYGQRGTKKQVYLLRQAGYYCLDAKAYRSNFHFFYKEFFESNLAYRFRPSWFNEFINEFNEIDYETAIEYMNNGWITLNKELVALNLVTFIYIGKEDRKYIYKIDSLLKYPITLERDIWYLFMCESNISREGMNRQTYISAWMPIFKELIERKKIDRKRVLRESLLTSTRNFNKVLSGWFFALFEYLEPTKEELFELQEEMMMVLSTPQSKPINTMLKYFKTMATEEAFLVENFMDSLTSLLTSEVKSTVSSTLLIVEKIAKRDASYRLKLSLLLVQAFMSSDEKIQIKVAKFIVKYGQEDVSIKEELALYSDNLLSSVKELLHEYLFEESELKLEEWYEAKRVFVRDENKIEFYKSDEELIFFFSQVFENNQPYHFDLFLELLQKIKPSMFSELEATLKRAIQMLTLDSMATGRTEYFMALGFIEIVCEWFTLYPVESMALQKIFQKYLSEEESTFTLLSSSWKIKKTSSNPEVYSREEKIIIERILFAKELALENLDLPLLATPTHTPAWIEFQSFVERLSLYEAKGRMPSLFDFQVAIGRLFIDENAMEQIASLKNEFKAMFMYLLDGSVSLDLSLCQKNPSYWLSLVYRKKVKEDMELFLEKFDTQNNTYFILGIREWSTAQTKKCNLSFKDYNGKWIKDDYSSDRVYLNDIQANGLDSIYHYFDFKDTIRTQDIVKILLNYSFNPTYFFEKYTQLNLHYTNWEDVCTVRDTEAMLPILNEIWRKEFEEGVYLFLATCFLFIKNPTRELAVELWINQIVKNDMNIALLGKCIGQLEEAEYAPLTRFTNLILTRMINLSSNHNEALEELLENIVLYMNPIKGTKKLLEIYHELLTLNSSKPSVEVRKKLVLWQEEKGLKAVIKKINSRVQS